MARVHPEMTWITIEEARQAWGLSTRSGFKHAREHGKVRMRKSGKVWLAYVPDLVQWFGEPRKPIWWNKKRERY